MTAPKLTLFNSLTRALEPFDPVHQGEARVYTCGPTVYNYQHIGNMRAYVFADTLGRVLRWKGYTLTHVINITDVGHLTSDADAGEDKMEKAAAQRTSRSGTSRALHRCLQGGRRAAQYPPARAMVRRDRLHRGDDRIRQGHCGEALLRTRLRPLFRRLDRGRLRPPGARRHRGRRRPDRHRRGQAQCRRFRDLAQDPGGRDAPDGMGFALGQGRARLASRMLGHGREAARLSLRHPHRRDRPPRDPPPERDRAEPGLLRLRRARRAAHSGARSGCTTISSSSARAR